MNLFVMIIVITVMIVIVIVIILFIVVVMLNFLNVFITTAIQRMTKPRLI